MISPWFWVLGSGCRVLAAGKGQLIAHRQWLKDHTKSLGRLGCLGYLSQLGSGFKVQGADSYRVEITFLISSINFLAASTDSSASSGVTSTSSL
jgi:hypothetical protein